MIIKDIQPNNKIRVCKLKIYEFIRKMTEAFTSSNISLIQLLLFYIIFTLPFVSILFKYDNHFPEVFSNVLRGFLITNFQSSLGMNWIIIDAIIICWTVSIILLTIAHFIFEQIPASITFFLSMLIKMCSFLSVPLVDFQIQAFQELTNPATDPTRKIMYGILIPLCTIALLSLCMLQAFEIRCLRKQTLFWGLSNIVHFYPVLFNMYKTAVISFGGDVGGWCLISLGVWWYHRQCKYYTAEEQFTVQFSLYDFIAATDAGVAVSVYTNSPNLGVSIWLALILAALARSLIAIYRAGNRVLYLPTCDKGPEQFYNFYYLYKQKLKGENDSWKSKHSQRLSSCYHLHRLFCCPKKCKLNSFIGKDYQKSIETVVEEIINSKRVSGMENRIINELWNLQLGKKVEVMDLAQKSNVTWSQDYVLWCIERLNKDSQLTLLVSQSNKQIICKAFYDVIQELSESYARFYDELSNTTPMIDVLVQNGIKIQDKIKQLEEVYSELLKQKMMNFRMLNLYNQFVKAFVGEKYQKKQDVVKLMKMLQDHFEDISQNPRPTFTFFPQSGALENVNAEGQKFLSSTKFDLKSLKVSDIFYPSISIGVFKALRRNKTQEMIEEPYFSYFKGLNNTPTFSSFRVKQQTFQQKNLLTLQILKQPFSPLKNYFLVSDDFRIQLTSKRQVKIKQLDYCQDPLVLNWQNLFEVYIAPNQEKIKHNRMIKVQTEYKGCTLVIKLKKGANANHFLIQAQIYLCHEIQTHKRLTARHSSIVAFNTVTMSSDDFFFQYAQNDQQEKAVLLGRHGSQIEVETTLKMKTLTPFQKSVQFGLVNNILNEDEELTEGIKTYRLWQGDLYNVDLEDKQAYNDQFEQHRIEQHKIIIEQTSSFEKYLVFGVIMLGIVLIGLSGYSFVHFSQSTAALNNDSARLIRLQSLMLDLNRIMAILKDQASGFSSQFPNFSVAAQINNSYNRIQTLKRSQIFQKGLHQLDFQSTQFEGQLIELVDVLLAHVSEVMVTGDLSMVEDIHFSYDQFIDTIELEEIKIHDNFSTIFVELKGFKNIILYIQIAIILTLFLTMILFCYLSAQKLKSNLSPLLFTPDSVALSYQQNARKIQSAIDLSRKNFEVDPSSLLLAVDKGRKRKKPKRGALSKQKIYAVVILSLFGVLIHVGCLVWFSSSFKKNFTDFTKMAQNSQTTLQVYTGSVQLAIKVSHLGQALDFQIDLIKQNMHTLAYTISDFNFSPEFNTRIYTIFFNNSCSILQQHYGYTQQECALSAPEFTIVNPFQMGLLYYFNRQNYYFYNNVTETFAHTSIYSKMFVRVYIDLMSQMNSQMQVNINNIQTDITIINVLIIIVDLCYLVVFIIIYLYFRRQLQHVQDIVEFMHKEIAKGTEEESEEGDRTEDLVEEEDEQTLLRKKNKTSRFKGTTLQREHESFSESQDHTS